jgi:hypothetical protein
MRPSCAINHSPQNRGRGECRVPVAPAASRVKKTRELVATGPPVHPAFPHAMVLTVSLVLSPVTGLVCHRRRRRLLRRLERQRRGVRTTRLRRPQPAPSSEAPPASIASRPASVTIASRPSSGTGRGDVKVIWVAPQRKYFCEQDSTGEAKHSQSRATKTLSDPSTTERMANVNPAALWRGREVKAGPAARTMIDQYA